MKLSPFHLLRLFSVESMNHAENPENLVNPVYSLTGSVRNHNLGFVKMQTRQNEPCRLFILLYRIT